MVDLELIGHTRVESNWVRVMFGEMRSRGVLA